MIDQQLLMPTLEPGSGLASMTIAELVDLLEGGTSMIDQTLLIPTLKTCVGIPAETIADIVALSSGGGAGQLAIGAITTDGTSSATTSFTVSIPLTPGGGRAWAIFLGTFRSASRALPTSVTLDGQEIVASLLASAFNASGQFSHSVYYIEESDLTALTQQGDVDLIFTFAATQDSCVVIVPLFDTGDSTQSANATGVSATLVRLVATAEFGLAFAFATQGGTTYTNTITDPAALNNLIGTASASTNISIGVFLAAGPLSVSGGTTFSAGSFAANLIVNPAT